MVIEGRAAVEFLQIEDLLLDARLESFKFEVSELGVRGVLKVVPLADGVYSSINIIFEEIRSFRFAYQSDLAFFYICDFKMLVDCDGFYLSFDPDPSTLLSAGSAVVLPSSEDNFSILAGRFSVEALA